MLHSKTITSDAIPYKTEFRKKDISTNVAIFTKSENIKINFDEVKKFTIFFIILYI